MRLEMLKLEDCFSRQGLSWCEERLGVVSVPLLDEFPHRRWEQSAKPTTNQFLVTLPNNSEINHPKANEGQDKGKHHTILEHVVG